MMGCLVIVGCRLDSCHGICGDADRGPIPGQGPARPGGWMPAVDCQVGESSRVRPHSQRARPRRACSPRCLASIRASVAGGPGAGPLRLRERPVLRSHPPSPGNSPSERGPRARAVRYCASRAGMRPWAPDDGRPWPPVPRQVVLQHLQTGEASSRVSRSWPSEAEGLARAPLGLTCLRLAGVGGDCEWWIYRAGTGSPVGYLRVPVTEAEYLVCPAGLVVADAGETGPRRPRTYLR